MRVRATLKLRNEVAIAAREKLGMTQHQVADASGTSQSAVSAIECLRFAGVCAKNVSQIATFLGIDPDELVPIHLRGENLLNEQKIVREIPDTVLIGMREPILIEDKDAPLQAEEIKIAIHQAIDKLTFREREILKLRHGIPDGHEYTMEEVGSIFQISRERVRQIEARAIRKLREPWNSEGLRAVMGEDEEQQ